MPSFRAVIGKIGINPYVVVPDTALDHLFARANKSTGPIPVKGTLNGEGFIHNIVKYAGAWRLYINGRMRDAADVDVGDTVKITLDFDAKPRTVKMHSDLRRALRDNKKAMSVFKNLTRSRQKEILWYFASLKSEEAVQRNLAKVMRVLTGDKDRFMARSWNE